MDQPVPSFRLLKQGAMRPQPLEVERNSRSRAARLRIAERTNSLSWSYKIQPNIHPMSHGLRGIN